MTGSVTDEQSSATTWTDMRGDRAFAMAVLEKRTRSRIRTSGRTIGPGLRVDCRARVRGVVAIRIVGAA